MINTVILSGRLTKDAELKTTQSGISVTSFTLAVDRAYKQGEDRQADFIPCVAWRGTAEFISKHFRKGNLIAVEGEIQSRKFTDKNGDNRIAYEVLVDKAHFMEKKPATESFAPADESEKEYTELDDDLPFA